jgi:hypothetical protein
MKEKDNRKKRKVIDVPGAGNQAKKKKAEDRRRME